MLHKEVGVGVSTFKKKRVMKVYCSTSLALQGGGWVSNFKKKTIM